MQWLAIVIVFGLAIGLRQRFGKGAQAFLVLGMAVIVGAWYLGLTRGT